jgi:phosphoribosyl-ATP pyrophosphohydrolase/phosphoribosyl-AMP cyclohydrolase
MSEELRAAIVQDFRTGQVLMLGWMDDEALRRTIETGEVHFFSRRRRQLWRKGETSGNTLAVVDVEHDCDDDALLVRVDPAGPTCHDGSTSCFTPWLWRRILQRQESGAPDSYVVRQLNSGVAANAQKVGEEATEVVVAAMGESDERVISEVADLWFHTLLLLRARGLDPAAVDEELRRRTRD